MGPSRLFIMLRWLGMLRRQCPIVQTANELVHRYYGFHPPPLPVMVPGKKIDWMGIIPPKTSKYLIPAASRWRPFQSLILHSSHFLAAIHFLLPKRKTPCLRLSPSSGTLVQAPHSLGRIRCPHGTDRPNEEAHRNAIRPFCDLLHNIIFAFALHVLPFV